MTLALPLLFLPPPTVMMDVVEVVPQLPSTLYLGVGAGLCGYQGVMGLGWRDGAVAQ